MSYHLEYEYELNDRRTSADMHLDLNLFLQQVDSLTQALSRGAVIYELEGTSPTGDLPHQFTQLLRVVNEARRGRICRLWVNALFGGLSISVLAKMLLKQ